jgi:hypothetical protein
MVPEEGNLKRFVFLTAPFLGEIKSPALWGLFIL